MDLPDPGIEPGSPELQAGSLPTELLGKSEGRDYGDVATSQGKQGTSELEKASKESPLGPLGGSRFCQHLKSS